jgi:hypothetical protein
VIEIRPLRDDDRALAAEARAERGAYGIPIAHELELELRL